MLPFPFTVRGQPDNPLAKRRRAAYDGPSTVSLVCASPREWTHGSG